MTRIERLAKAKALRASEKAIITAIKEQVIAVADIANLDEEKLHRRVQAALKSEYGRINGMINLLAAVCKWPAEQGDGASVAANQITIQENLGLDLLLLEDISKYKGFHTFATDEMETVIGVEPQYENYEDYTSILLEELGFEELSSSINQDMWERNEVKAKERAKKDLTDIQTALDEHKAFLGQ